MPKYDKNTNICWHWSMRISPYQYSVHDVLSCWSFISLYNEVMMTFTHDYCVKQTYIDKWQTSALSIHTLQRSLYKIWYLINACNVWLLCIVHTNLSVNGGKTVSCTKLSMGNGRCEIRYVLKLLVHSKVVAEFGRKEFLVDCLLFFFLKHWIWRK